MVAYYRREDPPSVLCSDSIGNLIMLHLAYLQDNIFYTGRLELKFHKEKFCIQRNFNLMILNVSKKRKEKGAVEVNEKEKEM